MVIITKVSINTFSTTFNVVFNIIFLLYKYLFNGKLIEPDESVYYNIYNSYGLKKIFLNLIEKRLEIELNSKLKLFKTHEWEIFLKHCYDLVPEESTIFDKKTLNIVILDSISSYRGWCHFRGLPTRGQRTWTNAWSAYKSNGILRNYKLKTFKKYYGNVPEKEATVAYIAEQLNFVWRFQWDREWSSAKNELLKFEGHPKTMKIDLYSMYNYQVIHPFKLKKMSKKQKQAFNKNYFSLGFDVGFTKVLLNERYNMGDNDGEKSTVSGASFITRDERLNKKKPPKKKNSSKKPAVRSKTTKKSVWD